MSEITQSDLEKAVSVIQKDRRSGDYRIEIGREKIFRQSVLSIAEGLNIDNEEYSISEMGVVELLEDILMKVGETYWEEDENIDIQSEFEKQKQELFSESFGNSPRSHDIVFPLNLQRLGSMPDRIDLGDAQMECIKYEEWQDSYLQPAFESEISNLEEFYDENPNDPGRFSWSYWRVAYPARDAQYAIYEVQDILRLMMAEINFIHRRWGSSMPRPAGSNRAPRDRWSHLQLPFVYLAFVDGKFKQYHPIDYDYRGGLADRTFMPSIESFDTLPGLYKRKNDLNEIESQISNTLIVFQDGITEPSFRRSFLDFWRGIERLAGKEELENQQIVARAEFAFDFVTDFEPRLRPKTEEAISELSGARNGLVHDWPETRIAERHRDAAKVLLDGLLTLYLEHRHEYEQNDFENLMEYGVMSQTDSEIKRVVKTLERLSLLE